MSEERPVVSDDLASADLIRGLADRMIPPENAEETLARIEHYLRTPYLQPRTAIPMALAAIEKWRQEQQR